MKKIITIELMEITMAGQRMDILSVGLMTILTDSEYSNPSLKSIIRKAI
jgi:hypothetical protein